MKFLQDNQLCSLTCKLVNLFKCVVKVIADVFILLGKLCTNRRIILKLVRADTKVIVADPLSRGDLDDWKVRRSKWQKQKIPNNGKVVTVRDSYWQNRISEIGQQY